MGTWKVPTCRKCGREHLNFVRCDEWDDFAVQMEVNKRKRTLRVHRQPLPEGERIWGDRFVSLERVGGNRFLRVREDDE